MKGKPKVAVIGGGWSGLAAAVELVARGIDITVFEAARQLGGRARSVEINGQVLDNGQHILVGAYRETLRLIRRVGLDPERQLQRVPLELNDPAAGFLMKLPRIPAPLNVALGLVFAKGCSACEKYSAARFMRSLQSIDYRLDRDCTVAELLDCHQQTGRLRRFLWEPLCLAALNTPPDLASAQIFANVLRDSLGGQRADTDLLLPATDLGSLFPNAAAEFIKASGGRVHLATRVQELRSDLEILGEHFDHVILAVAPQHAAHLLEKHEETAAIASLLGNYRYEPIGTVYAAYPAGTQLPCAMLGLDDGKHERLGQWVFARKAGDDQSILAFVLSADGRWNKHDNNALIDVLHDELEQTLGKRLPRPTWHRVIRERRATFSCRPNLPRPSFRTPLAGLWLAGDYVCADYPATLEGAIRSGVTVARSILA